MFLGLGCFFVDYLFYLGMVGMYGMYIVNMVIYESDFFISIGVCFDDWVIGNLKYFVLNVKIVYIDIDLVEIGKNVLIKILIVGDVKEVLK